MPDPTAQHPHPYVGKSQSKRLENVLLAAPAMLMFAKRGKLGKFTRTYALLAGPGILIDNAINYWRLEKERWATGKPDYWWNDPEVRTQQAFRVFDMALLAPAVVVAAVDPGRMNRPGIRKLAAVVGLVSLIYNWNNYFSVKALEERQRQVETMIATVSSQFDEGNV